MFYEYFLKGLEEATANEDKDKKVSVWEAFKYATESVDRFYKEQGRMATEHPQLAANGADMVDLKVKDAPAWRGSRRLFRSMRGNTNQFEDPMHLRLAEHLTEVKSLPEPASQMANFHRSLTALQCR